MPLFCISLLVLLLLPQSLSCDTKRPPKEVRHDYMAVVQTDLDNTRGSITTVLHNSSCPELKRKPHNCTTNNTDVVSTLHNLTCKMKNLRLSHTDGLAASVLNSIQCPCLEKSTKERNVRLKRRRTAVRRRTGQTTSKRETKKLCKANAILSSMTECYQMLNNLLIDT